MRGTASRKLELPAAGLVVVRQDLAGVATRQQTLRNPTDTDQHQPATGFSLAATLTTPQVQGRLRHPAVVLVAGSGPVDRDAVLAGIPLFAQLAGQLAEQGFVVVRYDKRGVGQSGGRTETVTLKDYADDAVAAVKWLAKRKDVDNRRSIVIAGYSEGAAVAMLAANEKAAGLVLMAGMGNERARLILEQQQHALDSAKVVEPSEPRKSICRRELEAAATAKGLEALPPEVRQLVDAPLYRSVLLFEPEQAMSGQSNRYWIFAVRWTRVEAAPCGPAAELGRARKKAASVEVKHISVSIIFFVPAKSGEVSDTRCSKRNRSARRSPEHRRLGRATACAERKIDYSVWRMRVGIPKKAGPVKLASQ